MDMVQVHEELLKSTCDYSVHSMKHSGTFKCAMLRVNHDVKFTTVLGFSSRFQNEASGLVITRSNAELAFTTIISLSKIV